MKVVGRESRAGDQREGIFRVPDDGQVGFDPAYVVEHLGVDDRAVGLAHVVGGDPGENHLGV